MSLPTAFSITQLCLFSSASSASWACLSCTTLAIPTSPLATALAAPTKLWKIIRSAGTSTLEKGLCHKKCFHINQVEVQLLIDSGSDATIITVKQWEHVKRQNPFIKLKSTKTVLHQFERLHIERGKRWVWWSCGDWWQVYSCGKHHTWLWLNWEWHPQISNASV